MLQSISRCLLTIILPLVLLNSCGGSGQSKNSSSGGLASGSGGTSPCLEAPNEQGYCLVWSDEFDSQQLDTQRWSLERDCYGGGNNEAQCYVDSADNVWLDGDLLHIKAIRQNSRGPAVPEDSDDYDPDDLSGSGTYTSGRLRSLNKGDWTYGRFEIRAKLPWGQGTWPAIWMLPSDRSYGTWAASGEIDIMEAVNLKVGGERAVHGTLHYGDNWPNNVYSGESYLLEDGSNPADGFHIYAVEWEQGEIRWYVDDHHFATQRSSGWYSKADLKNEHSPFDKRFHLILNLAVGGNWAAQVNNKGIDESVFPQKMTVDYVRVYQCSKDFSTGRGCASLGDNYVLNEGIPPPGDIDISSALEHTIFDGELSQYFSWLTYSTAGAVENKIVGDQGDYGQVAEISFNSDDGISFFQSTTPVNLSNFDFIEFDIRLVDDPRMAKGELVFRADCIYPCSSGNYSLGYPDAGKWTHYKILLSELAATGLDLNKVNTPFVIAPSSGNQRGLVLQVDNVRLGKAQ